MTLPPSPPHTPTPLPTEARTQLRLKVVALPALLTPTDSRELNELSSLARRVRAATPRLGRNRRASERLDALLLHHRTRGVSTLHLANATQLTERAIRTRLPELAQLPQLTLPPTPTPAAPELLPEFLIVWPGTSTSRRWWTYTDARSHLPARLVYSAPLTAQAHPLPAPYSRLSPQRASEVLGWTRTDPTARLIPDPTPATNGGEPLPAPPTPYPDDEELSA